MNLEIVKERISSFSGPLSTFNDEFVERLDYVNKKLDADGFTKETIALARNLYEARVFKIEKMVKQFNDEILAIDFEALGLKDISVIRDLIKNQLDTFSIEFNNELNNFNKIIDPLYS